LVVDFELVGKTPEENWIGQHQEGIAVGIAVVVITILLWICRGTGRRRSRLQSASLEALK